MSFFLVKNILDNMICTRNKMKIQDFIKQNDKHHVELITDGHNGMKMRTCVRKTHITVYIKGLDHTL